ncbi:gliding motility-associated C-terminal domain-containing protein [Zobellia alginiliquefaciens]|uniref:T9SS type B sorting domain-containing protein n=1 Tax=Zobellia alginiliquefaciens TaxID=3032586 RepID=UPI0023E458DB|nr:gliding motility-associated C-terminal domain-containing protein [Zobellia alginiliquefaciens]
MLFLSAISYAQNRVYADAITSESEVYQPDNAIDSDLSTNSIVRSSSGILLGVGAYAGHLELAYPNTLPANTTSFIKIATEDDILSSLLGGSLGGLLSDIVGTLLAGNQEFSAEAFNIDDSVLLTHSGLVDAFSTDEARVVTDMNGDYFLALTPSSPYDRVRITNSVGSLIGLGQERDLNVSGAYYGEGDATCGDSNYTSFSGDGLSLDFLGLGGAGVTDPKLAIDDDDDTFSELGLGLVDALASIEQTFYFDSQEGTSDNYYIKMAMDPSLLQLGIANSIGVIGQNGAEIPIFTENLSSLLDLDVLGLLESGQTAIVGLNPTAPIDRVTVRLSSLLGVGIDQELKIFDVFRAPASPVVTSTADDLNICAGFSTSVVAEVENDTNVELRWYDAQEDGNLLATLNSGEAFVTPVLNTDTTYYVAAAEIGCLNESPRTKVLITVEPIPTASDITVLGNENPICSSDNVSLVPTSSIDGTFSWYFDTNKTNKITDGMVSGGAAYEIDSNGVMTVAGLTEAGGPYTYFVSVKHDLAGCENAPGDLQLVEVDIVDFSKAISIDSNPMINLNGLIDIFSGNDIINVTGTVSGDVMVGEPISLNINGKVFDGVVAADSSFNISVNAIDLVSDVDNTIEAFVQGALCSVSDEILVDLPDLIIDDIFQVFCASDFATIADLEVGLNDIALFNDITAGVELSAYTPLVDGEVYFAGIAGIPASVLARVRITVQVNDVPMPTTNSRSQVFCESDGPTVGDIQVDQPNVVFYDSRLRGNAIDPSTPVEDGRWYYVAAVENGCESSERLRIMTNIFADGISPITIIGESEEVCRGRSYTYETNADKEDYVWTIVGGTITEGGTSTDNMVTVRWTELIDTQISVSYTDDSICSPSKMLTLDVEVGTCGMVLGEEFCLKVFNEFSPNNDGFNDFFTVQCIEDYSNTVEIYNRNGNLVYKTADYRNTWNGLANVNGVLSSGDHLPSGTYYYAIKIPELERNLVGWLQLAR